MGRDSKRQADWIEKVERGVRNVGRYKTVRIYELKNLFLKYRLFKFAYVEIYEDAVMQTQLMVV